MDEQLHKDVGAVRRWLASHTAYHAHYAALAAPRVLAALEASMRVAESLAERVAAQSDLLTRGAERYALRGKPLCPHCGDDHGPGAFDGCPGPPDD